MTYTSTDYSFSSSEGNLYFDNYLEKSSELCSIKKEIISIREQKEKIDRLQKPWLSSIHYAPKPLKIASYLPFGIPALLASIVAFIHDRLVDTPNLTEEENCLATKQEHLESIISSYKDRMFNILIRDCCEGSGIINIKGVFEKDLTTTGKEKVIEKFRKKLPPEEAVFLDEAADLFLYPRELVQEQKATPAALNMKEEMSKMLKEEFRSNILPTLYDELTKIFEGDPLQALTFLDLLQQGTFSTLYTQLQTAFSQTEGLKSYIVSSGLDGGLRIDVDMKHLNINLKKNFDIKDTESAQQVANLSVQVNLLFGKKVSKQYNINNNTDPKLLPLYRKLKSNLKKM